MIYGLPEHVIDMLVSVFEKYSAIEKVVLYGSRAKGNYEKGSDIDLCFFGNISRDSRTRLHFEIDDLPLPWMIDMAMHNDIRNQNLLEHIERAGKVIYTAPSTQASL